MSAELYTYNRAVVLNKLPRIVGKLSTRGFSMLHNKV